MSSPEKLAKWLFENNASAFESMTATYEEWLNIANSGYAPSMIISNGNIQSGVSALSSE